MNMRCYRLKSASNAFSTIRLIVSLITLLHPLAFSFQVVITIVIYVNGWVGQYIRALV